MSTLPIIYIEDDPDDAFFMETAFKRLPSPHTLTILQDGQQGIDYLAGAGVYSDRSKHPMPWLVLLDLNLPLKSGFDVLQWVREQPALRDLKVVVVSASGQQLDIDLAKKIGITDYIIKPTVTSRLTNIIGEGLGRWLGDC